MSDPDVYAIQTNVTAGEDFALARDHEAKPETDTGIGSEQVETDAPHLTLDPPGFAAATHYSAVARDAERAEAQTALFRTAFLGVELGDDDDSYGY